MTCKDCIHDVVCPHLKDSDAEKCGAFKNKADFVEVVRCGECKDFIPDSELDHGKHPNFIGADGYCDNCLRYTDKTDFCSGGEIKERF